MSSLSPPVGVWLLNSPNRLAIREVRCIRGLSLDVFRFGQRTVERGIGGTQFVARLGEAYWPIAS
jgi:hypothetical protein